MYLLAISWAQLIAKRYNLFYLDTGKIYRYIGKLKLENKEKFTYNLIKVKIKNIKLHYLKKKSLLSNEVAISAEIATSFDNKDFFFK